MAVSAYWYGNAFLKAFNKEIDFDSDTIKCMLCSNSYVPDQDGHAYKDVSVTSEVTGTNYTAGGATLAGKVISYDGPTNTLKIDADDVVFAASTITARYAVIYDDTPATNKPLLCYVDFGQDMSSTNADFTIQFSPSGIATLTVS